MANARVIGIIGGSGLYEIGGLSNVSWEKIDSPFGQTSDDFLCGELNGQKLIFLPRHGRGHKIPPSELNFRANIDALKRLGVTEIISLSACGSFKDELDPGTFVIIDQFIDHLWLEDGLSKNTLNSYRFDLSIFVSWLAETKKIELLDVSELEIQEFLAFKFPTSKSRSISRLLATLRRFFRFLLRENKMCFSLLAITGTEKVFATYLIPLVTSLYFSASSII